MKQHLHICYLCNEYPPARLVGGIGIFVRNIAHALVSNGHRVTVVGLYSQDEEYREENDQGVRVIRLSARARYLKLGWFINRRRVLTLLEQLVTQDGIDIIEAPDYEGMLWMARPMLVPCVVRLNGGEVYFRKLLGDPLKLKHRISEHSSLRRANAIASVSEYTWRETQRLFALPSQPVAILPNPVDTERFYPASAMDVVDGRIVYTGTFIRKKGVFELFSVLPQIFATDPNIHLVCVGADSRDLQTGASSSQQLALESLPEQFRSRVTFTGRLAHDQVLNYLQSARLCVYPSFLEAFPNAWLEAMACSKPIVASCTGSGPEVIEDGISGLLCDPADHSALAERIIALVQNRALAAQMGEAARQRVVDHFSMAHLLPKNIAWYRQVIDRHVTHSV